MDKTSSTSTHCDTLEWAEFLTRIKDIHDARQLALKNQTAKWSYKGVLDYLNTVATY